jgi:putative hemolysin
MTPRVEVSWIDVNAPAERVAEVIATSGHSRFPVARGRLDGLIGIVQVKDLAIELLHGKRPDLMAGLSAPLIVPQSIPILRLLERFREAGVHLAVVVDEYGAIEGIVTPHDILTAIAGELPELGEADVPTATRRADGSWLLDGRLDIHEVERLLGLADMAPNEEYSTLAGFVLWQLGRLPRVSDGLTWRCWRFEVVDMDGRRIDKLLVAPLASGGQAAAAPAPAPDGPGRRA